MPNNIYNRLEIIGNGEQVKQVRLFLDGGSSEDGSNVYIDFNNIIEMPEALLIKKSLGSELLQFLLFGTENDSNSWTIEEAQAYISNWSQETLLDNFEFTLKLQDNSEKYGYPYRNEWRLANWGTISNAYKQSSPVENIITFATAWCGVPDLMANLSSLFPEVKLHYSCNDNFYRWIFEIQNGEIITERNEEIVWVRFNNDLKGTTS